MPVATDSSSCRIEVPLPHATEELRLPDDAVIQIRRHGNPQGPRLLMCHGNGLAIDLYCPFWSLFLKDFDLMLFDLRNHGQNPLGDGAKHTIPAFCRDLEAVGRVVDRAFGLRPKVGIFHSVSCLVTALLPSLKATFSGLVCFDPPFGQSQIKRRILEAACHQAAARTRIRLGSFPTERRFLDLMSVQPAMERLPPAVTGLMARTTLRQFPGGRCELRCPPAFEAKILATMPGFLRMVDPNAFRLPVKVIGADPAIPSYFLPPCDLSSARCVDFEFLPGTTHLAQLEQPGECARLTIEFLRQIGFSRD